VSLYHLDLSNSCHFLFYSIKTSKYEYTRKEEFKRVFYSIYKQKRELSSHEGELSPEIQMYNIYNVWQPSLVLGGLGRALTVPIACEGFILGLALQAY
jgi:hypothetical protein